MTAGHALLSLPLAALLLTACSVDPAAERRELVLGITEAANTGDEDGLRAQVDSLQRLVERQLADEELSAEQADRLRALAEKVAAGADVLDEELQARLKAEADADRAKREADEAERLLEEERQKAEEGKGRGKGNTDDGDDEKDD